MAKIKFFGFVLIILDKLSVCINPPEDITVNDKFKASKSLILNKLYKKIIKIIEKK